MKDRGKRKGKRGKVKQWFPFLLPLFSFLFSFAFAHQPYWNERSPTPAQAFLVENVTISKALFGNLEAGEVDYFKLEIPEGLTIDSSLFVGGGCSENFNPRLYLLSPDVSNTEVAFALPEGYSATLAQGEWRPYKGHGLNGHKGPGFRKTFTGGIYYLVVQSIEESGFYLVSLSGSENFGAGPGGREAIPRFNACE